MLTQSASHSNKGEVMDIKLLDDRIVVEPKELLNKQQEASICQMKRKKKPVKVMFAGLV